MAEIDNQIITSVVREVRRHGELSAQIGDGYRRDGYTDTADYMDEIARRFEQLAAAAPAVFGACDRRDVLAANAAIDPETEACRVRA